MTNHRSEYLTEARRELSRRDLLRFIDRTFPAYRAGWFHREVCLALQLFAKRIREGKSPRIMILAPPRHGKSQIASRHFPTWYLGRHPTTGGVPSEVILASYASDLAVDHSRAAREIARTPETGKIFPGIIPRRRAKRHATDYVRNDVDRVALWSTGLGASYKAVGVGTATTGRGAHLLGIDDPIKDATEALSAKRRNDVWDWFQTTAFTRVSDGGGIFLTLTPWHVDDLRGRILDNDRKGRWIVLRFPAIAETDEHRHPWLAAEYGPKFLRAAGEALHPERWSLDRLNEARELMSPTWWSSLYQCSPVIMSGSIFVRSMFAKRWSFDPLDQNWDAICIFADLPFRKRADSDFAVFGVWGFMGDRMFLLDLVRDRMSYREAKRAARDIARRWRNHDRFVVEGRANGDALVDDLSDELPTIETQDPRNVADRKVLDARIAADKADRGEVVIPESAPWLSEWLEEHLRFTGKPGEHDDQVDVTSMAAIWSRDHLRRSSADDETDRILRLIGVA